MTHVVVQDKNVLITGATAGVGLAAAQELARRGAAVLMVGRHRDRGEAALATVEQLATGPAQLLFLADLSSQSSIRKLADEVRGQFTRIDVLVNNAGGMFGQRELTVDGLEKTFATNHLAPFLLTNLLLDLVRSASRGRIITVASESHTGRLDFDNLQGERHYNFFDAYNRSKLANILFTYELARRLDDSGVTANCVSPGPTRTTFGDRMTGLPRLFPLLMKRLPLLFHDAATGAHTVAYLASSPDLEHVSGRFFLDGRQRRTRPISYDRRIAARLWTVSAELCSIDANYSGGIRVAPPAPRIMASLPNVAS